jgi:DNA-3-methyladenine glycosylase II
VGDPGSGIRDDAEALAGRVPEFRRALTRTGPDFEVLLRGPGFGSLVATILAQQVSVDVASAMYRRLEGTLGGEVTPAGLSKLDDDTMRACGFTRQKAEYARGIAAGIAGGSIDLAAIGRLPTRRAIEALGAIRGVGRWTAECYLVFGLGSRDVFPAGDLALQIGWQELAGLEERPTEDALRHTAETWAPQRTAAAWLLWHWYLAERGRKVPG